MANRQGRSPGRLQRFDETARISSDVPSWAVDTGHAFRALAQVAGGIGDRLGRLADKAAQREGALAGLEAGAASGVAYLRQQAAQASAAGGDHYEMAKALLRKEEGFRETPYWDVNAWRTGYGSDTITTADGKVQRVRQGMKISREDAERDLARRLKEFEGRAVGQVGAEAWGSLSPAARAALLSVTYNYGSLPRSVVASVRQGGDIAGAVAGLSANQKRRQREAALIRSGVMPASSADASSRNAPPEKPIVQTLPETPLQLRRDGTIYGEAYDRAAMASYAWRMQAGLSSAMQAAYEANQDDPGALAEALAKVQDEFLQDQNLADPEVREAFSKTFVERSEAYLRSARAKAEQAMREEERAATFEGMAAQRLEVERQSVALGANPEGDRIIEREVTRAGRAIDAAVAAGTLSPAEGARQKDELATTAALARARGVYEALGTAEEKEQFATALLEDWKEGKGPLSKLPYAKVKALSTTLWNEARAEVNRKTAEQRVEAARLRARINDDLASMEATGRGLEDIDPKQVDELLGPGAIDEWQAKREVASRLWGATAGMETETPDQISARLATLEPKPGTEGFRDQEQIFQAATRKADAVLKARADDPAAAAEAAFPDVAQLASDADPQDPASVQAVVAARLQAQDALGLDEFARKPLKKAEALALARPVTMQHDPRAQAQAMAELVDQVNVAYGPHADAVLRQVLEAKGMDKDMAAHGAALFARLQRSGRATAADNRQGGVLAETAAAAAAGQPRVSAGSPADALPLPNYRQQQMLLEHPELAPQFDQKFGPGAAQRVLGARRSADDPLELREDGGTTRINPDGSESWTPD